MKRFFLLLLFFSCSSIEVNKSISENLDFSIFKKSYCTTHFCFYSNENISLSDISISAQNIFYYFNLNYSFNTINEYPYNFVVITSTSSKDIIKDYNLIYYSTANPCRVNDAIIKVLVDDIFENYKNNYLWLYYGLLEYVSSQFCVKKNLNYTNLLSKEENKIPIDTLIYLDPQKLSYKKVNIYYANVYAIVKLLIDNYSYYRFSLFVNDLVKTGDLKSSSLNVFGDDIFFIIKRRLI